MKPTRLHLPIGAMLICALNACASPSTQPNAVISSGVLVATLGTDTLSIEEFRRTATSFQGRLLRRIPRTTVTQYEITLGANRLPTLARFTVRDGNGAEIATMPKWLEVSFGADSATVRVQRDTLTTRRVALSAGIPMLPESYAMNEIWISSSQLTGVDSGIVTGIAPLGGIAGRLAYRVMGDSARAWIIGFPLKMKIDRNGRIRSADGSATPIKAVVTRVESVDLNSFATRFAARDAQAGPLGTYISRRDTARLAVQNANVWIDYGRPLTRGRPVFTNGVLGDTLWRTGANAATQLSTDKPLAFGSNILPPGKYSLWTRVAPDNSRYELVFNSQNGQWGTQRDRARDLFSVPLSAGSAAPTEQFLIKLEPRGENGSLRLVWDRVELATEFEVKQ